MYGKLLSFIHYIPDAESELNNRKNYFSLQKTHSDKVNFN